MIAARGLQLPELLFHNEQENRNEFHFPARSRSDGDIQYTTRLPPLPHYATLDRTALPTYEQESEALSVKHIQRYLLFLGSVNALKKAIIDLPINVDSVATTLDSEERWSICVQMAVNRYGLWQRNMLGRQSPSSFSHGSTGETKMSLPPFDVLMIWAAYLQCPSSYAMDVNNFPDMHPSRHFESFPLEEITSFIDEHSLKYAGSFGHTCAWKDATAQPYDTVDAFKQLNQVQLRCPHCETIFSHPWLRQSSTGYGQHNFAATCPTCSETITQRHLILRRLVDDLRKTAFQACSTLSSIIFQPDAKSLREMAELCASAPHAVGKSWSWRRDHAAKSLASLAASNSSVHIEAFMATYICVETASIDLIATALRYTRFIEQLDDLQWLVPGRFAERNATVQKALARYYSFASLSRATSEALVPTLGIELAWQTHTMFPTRYEKDWCHWIGSLPNRLQVARAEQLAELFEETARKWEAKFHVLYSTSGHFFPDSPNALARLASRLIPAAAKEGLASHVNYESPLVYSKLDSLLSRPCERNAVTVLDSGGDARLWRERRMRLMEQKLARENKLATRGFVDAELLHLAKTTKVPFAGVKYTGHQTSKSGYPIGENGIIVSANEVSLAKLRRPGRIGWGQAALGQPLLSGGSRRFSTIVLREQRASSMEPYM